MSDAPDNNGNGHADGTGKKALPEDRDKRGRWKKGNSVSWKPGQSGNLAGRKPSLTISAELRKLVEANDNQLGKALARKAAELALQGDFRFLELVLDRLEGKVTNKIDLTGADSNPAALIVVAGMSPDAIARVAELNPRSKIVDMGTEAEEEDPSPAALPVGGDGDGVQGGTSVDDYMRQFARKGTDDAS